MHIHSLRRAALAACAFAALAAPSAADAVTTQLRVEADGKDIGPGFHYVHDSVTYTTSTNDACGGTGESGEISGPSALGLLIQAADFTRKLRPVEISDQFAELGPFVCGVGGYQGSMDAYWLYKVDHVAPEVGADKFTIDQSFDEVLWYFVNTKTKSNTGNELELVLRKQVVQAGKPVEVKVREYDANGKASPANGVRLKGAGERTDEDGVAKVVFDEAGEPFIRGVRGPDIPTDVEHLCVWEKAASECDDWLTGWVVGTGSGDAMRGTANPERITGRAGGDRINSRGDGQADSVRCGPGKDVVQADELDRVKPNCETVKRR